MATLFTLPLELLFMIMSHVDEKDILAFNSVSRDAHALVKPIFASVFGSDRTFELYSHDMATLLKLSRDTIRAPYLKTLIFVHNGTSGPLEHIDTLTKALKNLGAYGNVQTLGIRYAYGVRQPNNTRAYNLIKPFLSYLLATAVRMGLPIKDVVFEIGIQPNVMDWSIERRPWALFSRSQQQFVTEISQVFNAMDTLHDMGFPELGRGFRFTRKGHEGTQKSPSMIYNPKRHSLIVQHLEVDDWRLLLQWLPATTLLQTAIISDCNVEFRAFNDLIINPALTSLSIEDVTLVSNLNMTVYWHFSNPASLPSWSQTWQEVFDRLSAFSPNLSHCRLGQLGFHYSTYTGATWEANSIENVQELLRNLRWGKRSRLAYKKVNAPSSGPRKPRKKALRTKKLRITHKKPKKTKN